MTIPTITIQKLFDTQSKLLSLTWVSDSSKSKNIPLEATNASHPGMALIGYLNFIHPNRIQVIGRIEHSYLESLSTEERSKSCLEIFSHENTASVIIADKLSVHPELVSAAENTNKALLSSEAASPLVIDNLQYYLTRSLAPRISIHGVYMEVFGVGVLITGKSGIGKSELALELLSRNHRLIADDAVELVRIAPDILLGQCPDVLSSYLEVRGLGILDIRAMFGETAIRHQKNLHLIIRMEAFDSQPGDNVDRLQAEYNNQVILDTEIPEILLYVAPGRNLAVLVEAAVRSYILRIWGINPVDDFIKKQQDSIDSR